MKVGDKIEILSTNNGGSLGWWNKGDIYELTEVSTNRFSCKKSCGETNGWDYDNVKFRVISDQITDNYLIY